MKPAIGTIVAITTALNMRDPGLNRLSQPFRKVGTVHIVTGHHPQNDDIFLDNNRDWSVGTSRVTPVPQELFIMTSVRNSDVAGCLLECLPGERIVHITTPQGSTGFKYLDRKQDGLHYSDGDWVQSLLDAGVIRRAGEGEFAHEEPQRFNSVYDAPIGMVLKYMLDGQKAQGAVYPYVVRTFGGIWGWNKQRWVLIKPEHQGQWLHDIQAAWTAPAFFQEAFTYPIPCKAILYVQKLMGAANA